MRPKVIAAIAVLLCATVIGLLTHASGLVQNMPVCVSVQTNAPPWAMKAGITNDNWFTEVPYAQATNQLVSENDVREIKNAIPTLRTVGSFYARNSISINSPDEAVANFARRGKFLSVQITRQNDGWHVSSIERYKACGPPRTTLDKISNALP